VTRRLPLLGAALLLGAACVSMPPGPPPAHPIRFLSINDVYVADTLGDGLGGLARVASVRQRLSELGPVIFVAAGDLLSPSLLGKYYAGRQMVEALNAAKLDYATFGNHDFDLAEADLLARLGESKFKWLSANCTRADGSAFPNTVPWDTVRVRNELVGLLGLTMAGPYRRHVRCTDPDSAARPALAQLEAAGATLVVAVTHRRMADDLAFLGRERMVQLVLGGHEHAAADSSRSGRHVLKADANARSAQFATLWGGRDRWQSATRLLRIDRTIAFDTAVRPVVDRWRDSLVARLGAPRVVARVVAPLDLHDEVQRRTQTAFGSLVTDAIRAGTGADVALLHAGAMRYDDLLPEGPATNWDVEGIFLFADETRIVRVPVTGARLRELLEHGIGQAGSGGYPQLSGVQLRVAPARPAGGRLVGDVLRPDGTPIAPVARVTLALPAYLACEGGDGYRLPEAAEACAGRDDAPRTVDLLLRHVEERLGGRIEGRAEGRVILVGG